MLSHLVTNIYINFNDSKTLGSFKGDIAAATAATAATATTTTAATAATATTTAATAAAATATPRSQVVEYP